MVLWDGSVHRWFGEGHPPCCLVVAIDDATSRRLVARFFPFESSQACLWLLRQMLREYGIPLSIYQDRHSCLKRNDGAASGPAGSHPGGVGPAGTFH